MLGTSSSIANVGDQRKEGEILPHVIYIYSICYVIVRLRITSKYIALYM